MPGIRTMTIHAPCVNFVSPMIRATTAVASAPVPFSTARNGQPAPRWTNQYRTMLACESVNDTNTPSA
jgi:hypothetical protein